MRLNIHKVFFLILLLVPMNLISAEKDSYEIKQQDIRIRITGADVSIDSVVKNYSDDNWMTLDKNPAAFDFINKNSLWIRLKIPDFKWNQPSLCLQTFMNEFEIFRDGSPIYQYGYLSKNKKFDYYKWHVVSIDSSKKSVFLFIRVPTKKANLLGGIVVKYFGEKAALEEKVIDYYKDFFKTYTKDVILGILLLFICFISCVIFFIRFKAKDYAFLYFSFLAFLGGITYLDDTPLIMLQNISPLTYSIIEEISVYVLPIAVLLFVGKLFGSGWKRIIRIMCIIHLIILVVAFTLMFFPVITEIPFFCYVGFVFVDFVLMFIMIFKSRTNTVYKLKPVLISFILFSLCCIQDMLVLLDFLPWGVILFGWGLLGLVFTFGYMLIKHYMDTYHLVNIYSNEIEEQKTQLDILQQENLLSQFEALKNQVNPHFLFNTFSTLISVIEENPDMAANFVQQLSNVYRYVLQSKDNHVVELKSELEFLESYNFLLSKRYGSNLVIENCIGQDYLDWQIPPLTLQLLVENAIKHNIISSKKPLKVEIKTEENDYLCVRNNLQKKNIVESSMKIGLQNIINRYKYLCDKHVDVISNQSFFIVKVPLLNKKDR